MGTFSSEIAELIFLKEENILHIKIRQGSQMNLKNTVDHYDLINKITQGNKYKALVDASEYFTIDPDAFEYAATPAALENRIAAAHYNGEIANKITATYFKNHYQPPIPFQQFNSKEEAMAWLAELK